MSNNRVGIYSGVFDPVHKGHLGLAEAALNLGLVDKVYILVEPEPLHKKNVSDYRHRLSMAWLATHEHPKIDLLVMDDHPQFTIRQTLPELEKRFGPVSLIMGSDQAQKIHTWPDYPALKGRTRLIIGQREGSPVDSAEQKLPIEHVIITTTRPNLSASQIRGESNKNQSEFLSRPVAQYIAFNQLY